MRSPIRLLRALSLMSLLLLAPGRAARSLAREKAAPAAAKPQASPAALTQGRAACEANEKQLLEALRAYSAESGGALPDRLSRLFYGAYVDRVAAFACPGSGRELTDRTQIDDSGGYVLLVSTWPTARAPVLGDRAAANHGGQVCVAFSDGSFEWMSALPGAPIAAAPSAPPGADPTASAQIGPFTGVIVDCRGLDVKRGMWPKIVSNAGEDVWKATKDTDVSLALERGLVSYQISLEEARRSDRVGGNPLLIKAVGAAGTGDAVRIYPVVTPTDAQLILEENSKSRFLDRDAICFITD